MVLTYCSFTSSTFFVLLQTAQVSGLFAAHCDLIAEQPVVWLRLALIRAPAPGGDWAHTAGCEASLCGSALTCCSICSTNVAVYCDQKSTECTCVSQPLQQSGFSRTSPPIGHFWPSKITSGVDYMLSSASPNYSPAFRSTASSQKTARWQKGRRPAGLTAAAAILQDW